MYIGSICNTFIITFLQQHGNENINNYTWHFIINDTASSKKLARLKVITKKD